MPCPLHDIGKIGVPDHILLKPSRLDGHEFEVMKRPCEIGHHAIPDSLQRFPRADYLEMSADIAYCHHEKFGGGGYPRGLVGKDIPLSARIVALAGVFDALVCKRVCQNALPVKVARVIIVKDKSTHFDPELVENYF